MIKHNFEHFEFEYIDEKGIKAGRLRYRYIKKNVINAYSTRVDEAFQGKGIAGKLYEALIVFAQDNKLKINPSCSYIEIKMQRNHQKLITYCKQL